MFQIRSGKALSVILVGLIAGAGLSAIGCKGGGDTDGGSAVDGAEGGGSPIVSDGGSGGSIQLIPNDDRIGVGEIIGFRVILRDAQGAPIPFVRVFCETEKGLAIIEPSSGGTSFENTDENGHLSGKIGGLTPGSFLMECRANEGFNLVDRETVIVEGDVPEGFQGFPGAAGGNLGGGVIVDETPDPNDGGVRISAVQFNDAGENGSGLPLDLTRNLDCSNDGNTTTTDIEPFVFPQYVLTIANDTAQRIVVDTAQLTVRSSGGGTVARLPAQGQTVEIEAGSTGTVSGLFVNSSGRFAGTSVSPSAGTFGVTITINGTTEDGTDFSVSEGDSVSFDSVDNCPGS